MWLASGRQESQIFAPGVEIEMFQFVMALLCLEFEPVSAFEMDDRSGADEFLADDRSLHAVDVAGRPLVGQLHPVIRDDEGRLVALDQRLGGVAGNVEFVRAA